MVACVCAWTLHEHVESTGHRWTSSSTTLHRIFEAGSLSECAARQFSYTSPKDPVPPFSHYWDYRHTLLCLVLILFLFYYRCSCLPISTLLSEPPLQHILNWDNIKFTILTILTVQFNSIKCIYIVYYLTSLQDVSSYKTETLYTLNSSFSSSSFPRTVSLESPLCNPG